MFLTNSKETQKIAFIPQYQSYSKRIIEQSKISYRINQVAPLQGNGGLIFVSI